MVESSYSGHCHPFGPAPLFAGSGLDFDLDVHGLADEPHFEDLDEHLFSAMSLEESQTMVAVLLRLRKSCD